MSDFDKEAERERLRERFEEDQKRREATERMSDLLLKGATMTNKHCDTCGSPLFRANGEEFCPHCQNTDQDTDQKPQQPPQETEDTELKDTEQESTQQEPQRETTEIHEQVGSSDPQKSLLAVITAHANQAREADDPRRATDHLKAAREAAEIWQLLQDGHSS